MTAPPRPSLRDFATLSKARIQALSLGAALACAWLASGGLLSLAGAAHLALGLSLVSCCAAALNQLFEVEVDALMERTRRRPLPSGRMSRRQAATFAVLTGSTGLVWLAVFLNPLCAWLALVMIVLYDFIYTPLKRVTSLNTLVGALPGAMPLLIGWAAAGRGLDLTAGVLYAILFLWQLPHFLSIAWIHQRDYARAGLKMLPAEDAAGRLSARQAANYALVLVPVSLLPTLTGAAGVTYFYGALTLSLAFLAFVIRFSLRNSLGRARGLMRASIAYLPLLLALLVVDSAPAQSRPPAEASSPVPFSTESRQ